MKILHIDDCPQISAIFSDVLRMSDHEFESTIEGKNGLELVLKNNYDVILLDLRLPYYTGFEFLADLKSSRPSEIRKVVIVSALELEEFQIQFLKNQGVYSIHKKPISIQYLISKMMPQNLLSNIIQK